MKQTSLFKKLLCALMACLMCVSMLVACGDEDGTTTTTPPPAAPSVLDIVKDGESEYQIVLSANASKYESDVAYKIREIALIVTGARIPVVDDSAPVKDTEIVVGSTSRKSLYTSPVNYGGGYSVFVEGKRLILELGSTIGAKRALQNLAIDCFGVNIVFEDYFKGEELSALTVPVSYKISDTFSATYFAITYDGTYMQKRMAYSWQKMFLSYSSNKHIIEMGVFDQNNGGNDGVQIKLVTKDTVLEGNWEVHRKSDGTYEIYASDYYGFTAAGRFFIDHVSRNRGKENELPNSQTGNYKTSLERFEMSSAYAYEKTAEYRVMFNNILWGSPAGSERTTLATGIISIYKPDVLGLQEVNLDRRGNQPDGKGGIIDALAELGYAETIDPRVRNSYGTDEEIPGTDASLTTDTEEHVPLKGYGKSSSVVTVDGETFTTYYNCTPLLYNTATTKCLASGYYWYKNQWDRRLGMNHENGAGDCASKSATWGLFEDLETGEQYIAISTHMCTRSEYVRGLQGAEVVELVNSLIEEYNVPVMFGGDYNGNVYSSNFAAMKAGGMVDVQSAGLASEYTSKVASHHPYPEYDTDINLVQPAPGDTSGRGQPDNSIDRIMVKNHDTMDITVYGTVIDEYSKSSADHFPVFIDFSINASSDQPAD